MSHYTMHTLTLWVLNINEGRKAVDSNLNVSSSVTGLFVVVTIFIAACVVVKHILIHSVWLVFSHCHISCGAEVV